MELSAELKRIYIETAAILKGSERRVFMAKVVLSLGQGGPTRAETELGWNRGTIRKGLHELESGMRCVDNFAARGRKRAEYHLPNLLADIQSIVDGQSQTDPTFTTTRLYTRISAAQVRHQLQIQKGYTNEQLPTEETLRQKLNQLGYQVRSVQKSRPQKKIPQTGAIFDHLHQKHTEAREDETILRISIDAKATIPIGSFSRGGQSRVVVRGSDHDFASDEKLTPFGIFLPHRVKLYLYFTKGPVTSDFIVDCLADFWNTLRDELPQVKTLLINSDNGPENHSRRTQFMKRIVELSHQFQINVYLAYYPPYHSKYNPIERVFGVLEQHWNGSLLDSVQTIINFAKTMTYNGIQPVVKCVERAYQTGKRLTAKQMDELENRFQRLAELPKWFVTIPAMSA